jgi:hypothetical protein
MSKDEMAGVRYNTRVGESIQGGMARVVEHNNTSSLKKNLMEEGDGAADSTSAGWDGMQHGRVQFPPKTLSEEAHPGCADREVKVRQVTDDKEGD